MLIRYTCKDSKTSRLTHWMNMDCEVTYHNPKNKVESFSAVKPVDYLKHKRELQYKFKKEVHYR